MNDEELRAFERSTLIHAFEDLRAWARERARRGDPRPEEFLRRLRAVETITKHAMRLTDISMPGTVPYSARRRIDGLRERCGERLEVAGLRLARTVRSFRRHDETLRPIHTHLDCNPVVRRLVDASMRYLHEESKRRANGRAERARDPLTVASHGPSRPLTPAEYTAAWADAIREGALSASAEESREVARRFIAAAGGSPPGPTS